MDDQTILGIVALIMGIGGVTWMEITALKQGINGNRLAGAVAAVAGMAGLAFGLGIGG